MDLRELSQLLEPDPLDLDLVHAIQGGLPLVEQPYAQIASELNITETEVIRRLGRLLETGDIRRLGVVVRHRELGYRANAMVVWDVPDDRVSEIGQLLGRQSCVTLCYRRPRRPGRWPYNLFCMIHGRSREGVLRNLDRLIHDCNLGWITHDVLFSLRQFKQRGAKYISERDGSVKGSGQTPASLS
ncbi:MAG: AsnC family protein [Candidatus Thiodiazotropha sp. (ex Cardiolucina cf. quadrata)]|nr:AsnC family protein [Candidatus Thiodiazotropha sp. (ex Cardiolucina cf. quadrata)]